MVPAWRESSGCDTRSDLLLLTADEGVMIASGTKADARTALCTAVRLGDGSGGMDVGCGAFATGFPRVVARGDEGAMFLSLN